MLISGAWLLCSDGTMRPVFHGEVRAADGSWIEAPFLADTGADCTVLSANILDALRYQPHASSQRLGGLGGEAPSIVIDTQIQFPRENGTLVVFRGPFAGTTRLESLDMSVLGRDITNLFALIVDRPTDLVAMLRQRHQYRIEEF